MPFLAYVKSPEPDDAKPVISVAYRVRGVSRRLPEFQTDDAHAACRVYESERPDWAEEDSAMNAIALNVFEWSPFYGKFFSVLEPIWAFGFPLVGLLAAAAVRKRRNWHIALVLTVILTASWFWIAMTLAGVKGHFDDVSRERPTARLGNPVSIAYRAEHFDKRRPLDPFMVATYAIVPEGSSPPSPDSAVADWRGRTVSVQHPGLPIYRGLDFMTGQPLFAITVVVYAMWWATPRRLIEGRSGRDVAVVPS